MSNVNECKLTMHTFGTWNASSPEAIQCDRDVIYLQVLNCRLHFKNFENKNARLSFSSPFFPINSSPSIFHMHLSVCKVFFFTWEGRLVVTIYFFSFLEQSWGYIGTVLLKSSRLLETHVSDGTMGIFVKAMQHTCTKVKQYCYDCSWIFLCLWTSLSHRSVRIIV